MLTNNAIVIIEKETDKVICEFFNGALASKINTKKYKAIPVLKHLQCLNK